MMAHRRLVVLAALVSVVAGSTGEHGSGLLSYHEYTQKYGGSKADYKQYVDLYSEMAGSSPMSAGSPETKADEQLTAWKRSQQVTSQQYVPDGAQQYSALAVSSRPMASSAAKADTARKPQVQATSSPETKPEQGAAVAPGTGNYQQYMNYQKYMLQAGAASAGGTPPAQGGGYQQYMQQYADGFLGQRTAGAHAANLASGPATSQVGGYQQYMDYQNYMSQGGAGGAGVSQPQVGGYQQYMDYQKLMSQGGAGGAGVSQPQVGGYQQYMDYQKFMSQGGTGGAGASQPQAGGHQHVSASETASVLLSLAAHRHGENRSIQYASNSHKSTKSDAVQPAGFDQYVQQYGDYLNMGGAGHFMQQYAGDYVGTKGPVQAGEGPQTLVAQPAASAAPQYLSVDDKNSQSSGAGNYQQYMSQYGDYQKYIQQFAGSYMGSASQGSSQIGASNLVEQQKTSEVGQQYADASSGGGAQAGSNYQQYVDQFAGDFSKYARAGAPYTSQYASGAQHSASQGFDSKQPKVDVENYASQYDGTYTSKNMSDGTPVALAAQLQAGNRTQAAIAAMEKNAYAKPYAHFLEAQQATNKLAAPPSAEACHTLEELQEWRRVALQRVKGFVPAAYSKFPEKTIEDQFKSNVERIKRELGQATSVVSNSGLADTTADATADTTADATADPAADATADPTADADQKTASKASGVDETHDNVAVHEVIGAVDAVGPAPDPALGPASGPATVAADSSTDVVDADKAQSAVRTAPGPHVHEVKQAEEPTKVVSSSDRTVAHVKAQVFLSAADASTSKVSPLHRAAAMLAVLSLAGLMGSIVLGLVCRPSRPRPLMEEISEDGYISLIEA